MGEKTLIVSNGPLRFLVVAKPKSFCIDVIESNEVIEGAVFIDWFDDKDGKGARRTFEFKSLPKTLLFVRRGNYVNMTLTYSNEDVITSEFESPTFDIWVPTSDTGPQNGEVINILDIKDSDLFFEFVDEAEFVTEEVEDHDWGFCRVHVLKASQDSSAQ